jgi:ABC-2 type transport system ATP-binding protein
MSAMIYAEGLSKTFGKTKALESVNLRIGSGQIVGLIGPNGSGKTTTLKALVGLIPVDGALQVMGLDPVNERDKLMQSVSFIADVAILPRWIRVSEVVSFVEGIHPKFSRAKAEAYIARTKLTPKMRVKDMSKGMIVQLHLALIMAIDADLLILDEPTLGLDIIYRKQFYRSLLEDYFDEKRTIVISTHQIEEIENVLTHLVFINGGKTVLHESMEDLAKRFTEVRVPPEHKEAALALQPIDVRGALGSSIMLFDGVDKRELEELGEIKIPALSDVFVATINHGNKNGNGSRP